MKFSRFNGNKIYAYTDRVLAVARGKYAPPIKAFIAPTSRCNYNCQHCLLLEQQPLPVGELSPPVLNGIIDDLVAMGCEGVSFSGGGEPTLHSHFLPAIERANRLGMFVDVTTNGGALPSVTALYADSIRVSFDAADPTTYGAIHGVSKDHFDHTCENVVGVLRERGRRDLFGRMLPHVGLLFLATEDNYNEVRGFIRLADNLGVDYALIRPSWALRREGHGRDELINALEGIEHKVRVPFYVGGTTMQLSPKCYMAALVPSIRWDGKLMLCQSHQNVVAADLADYGSFREAWESMTVQNKVANVDPSLCKHMCCFAGANARAHYGIVKDAIVRCMV